MLLGNKMVHVALSPLCFKAYILTSPDIPRPKNKGGGRHTKSFTMVKVRLECLRNNSFSFTSKRRYLFPKRENNNLKNKREKANIFSHH